MNAVQTELALSDRRTVTIACHSAPWASVLRRNLAGEYRLDWLLGLDDWQAELASTGDGLLLVEIQPASLTSICRQMVAGISHPDPLCLLAIGQTSDAATRQLLRQAGFAACFGSFGELDQLLATISRHFQERPSRPVGIEERVWRNLPWNARIR